MNRPRTLDSMYGTGITPDEAPHVERTVDGEDYSVDVDLTPAATTLLEALAATMNQDDDNFRHWWMLGAPGTGEANMRAAALHELLANRAVRQALTIRLTPETADNLASDLQEAAYDPPTCDQYDHGDRCTHYAAPGERQCPRHLPADPQP